MVWKVGTGEKVKFWENEWLDNGQLKERYERLYNNYELKDKSIGSFGRWSTKGWEWFEWEKTMVEEFMTIIAQVSLHQDIEDKQLWNDPPSYSFSVKPTYNKLVNHRSRGFGGV